jgi:hypothetical protein
LVRFWEEGAVPVDRNVFAVPDGVPRIPGGVQVAVQIGTAVGSQQSYQLRLRRSTPAAGHRYGGGRVHHLEQFGQLAGLDADQQLMPPEGGRLGKVRVLADSGVQR